MTLSLTSLSVLLVGNLDEEAYAIRSRFREVPTFESVIRLCGLREAAHTLREMHFDVVVLDIDATKAGCVKLVRGIRERHSSCRIMFVGDKIEDEFVHLALDIGAMSYLSKREKAAAVVTAIQEVAEGRTVFSGEVWERIVALRYDAFEFGRSSDRVYTLTPRELEIAQYIARGLTDKEIARMASISTKTVETHSAHIRNKLGIRGRVDIARYAIRRGLVVA